MHVATVPWRFDPDLDAFDDSPLRALTRECPVLWAFKRTEGYPKVLSPSNTDRWAAQPGGRSSIVN